MKYSFSPQTFLLYYLDVAQIEEDKICLFMLFCVVKGTQSSPTLCDPVDYTVHGILQARILEWVDVPFSRGTQVFCIAGGFFTS